MVANVTVELGNVTGFYLYEILNSSHKTRFFAMGSLFMKWTLQHNWGNMGVPLGTTLLKL